MKTLEHEIRDVLSGKDLEELRLLEEFIDYAAENYVITEEDEQYLVELAPIALVLGTGARALLGGIIRNAPKIGQSILKSLKRGGQRAKVLSRRLSRAAKRRKGAVGAAAGGLVQHGVNGFVVPERDSATLAQAIEKVLTDARLREEMSRNARRIVAKWGNENMVEGFRQAIDYALRKTG